MRLIHNPGIKAMPGFWIPACAGMTVGAAYGNAGVWIPAFAGMTVERAGMSEEWAGMDCGNGGGGMMMGGKTHS